jgi:hypothetical protein
MADLESLGYKSISEMSTDEAIEHLRQIRLSRRVPAKTTKPKKESVKKQKNDIGKMSPEEAKKLLEMIGE